MKEVKRPRIEKCGLMELFDSIIVSDEIGIAKPDTAFFDYALKPLDPTIDKNDVLVIDDSIKSDITEAKASGIRPSFIMNDSKQSVNADIIIDDVLQLPSVLDDIYYPC